VVAKLEGKHWMFQGDNARRIDVVENVAKIAVSQPSSTRVSIRTPHSVPHR